MNGKKLEPVPPVEIERLSSRHNRRHFCCGSVALDTYLIKYAGQHAKANISRTFVAIERNNVRGFYSLSMAGIRRDNLPLQFQKRFPNLPLPVARLARLAVDLSAQQKGLGELLLVDALQRCLQISTSIGMLGVIVDAKNEQLRGWYERYEFTRLPDQALTLWIPTLAIAAM